MASAGAVLCLLALGMSAWAVVSADGWPLKTALFPVVIGVPVLLLGGVELYLTVAGRRAPLQAPAARLPDQGGPPDRALARRRTLATFGWIAALFLLVIGIGFLAAVPAFVLLYLRLQGRERWAVSLAMAAATWAVVYGLFVRLLHLPLAEGLVLGWLRALGVPW